MNVLIIPAAGRGSRLAFDGPKLLYPLGGRPLIDYLLERFRPFVDHVVLVIHPDMEAAVSSHLDNGTDQYSLDYQQTPTGMLDAIVAPMDRIRSWEIDNIWIAWCDQVGITEQTATTLADSLHKAKSPCLVLPTIKKQNPYIHLARDTSGNVVDVLQQREGDEMPDVGENDCGLFGLSADTYFSLLPMFCRALSSDQTGSETAERNFLPFIAWLHNKAEVITFDAAQEAESLGINTIDDAMRILKMWND